jgi:pyruvate dehydrogenase E2 component (dihydrolipoamide acetyltransferase)
MVDVADLVMPKLGLTMTEGRIARWAVVPGARFAAGEVIVEIETDKIVNEVEAPSAGTLLELLEPEGATTPVGVAIARWQLENAVGTGVPKPAHDVQKSDGVHAELARAPAELLPAKAANGRTMSTPYARKLAKQAGLEIGTIEGTGPRGRIKAADVERAAGQRPSMVDARPEDALRGAASTGSASPARELSFVTIDVDVRRLREIEQSLTKSAPGLALERRHYVALACVRALTDHESNDAMLAIGFEVDTAHGPKFMTFFARPRTTLSALVAQHADLELRARQGHLRPEDLGSGRVLILAGSDDTRVFGPAVPPGWSVSVGVGSVREVLRLGPGGAPLIAHEMSLALSYAAAELAHASALTLLGRIKALLEEPLSMLVS